MIFELYLQTPDIVVFRKWHLFQENFIKNSSCKEMISRVAGQK